MAGKNTAVYGIYPNIESAEKAVDVLVAQGFSEQDVSVLMADTESNKQFAHQKHTKAPEGTAAGVTAGGVVGGTVGLLAGLGALAIPGVGPLIAAGPIMGALAGFGVGGAVGGLVGALVGAGIPEYEAKRYEGRVKDGGVLLSVHCETSEEITSAKNLLKGSGADDIASSSEGSAGKRDTDAVREGEKVHTTTY
ncbi:Succinyl-CoA ligase [ADP-forming] beta chain [Acidisarcina polymorpha]|uniref:Succinyl-CoA ligase [ADP-forming] beta chain n=1 Tax=Acidisarcina polymorpha TaxID=2211140 RepID=A0A2Z5FVG6_9BACT|nr:general stress protein [Acidisarcina polymorpha]AXC10889.1 Succinyl-CoA ligase [ADP-forming] beta chain [Acidisarcina polymorpha]